MDIFVILLIGKKNHTQKLDNARDIAVYCDKNNWNSIWFTEHHFNHEGMESSPNPLMICADIAARTKQIRLGQACNVITFWNPIRLAEDIATLDNLSNGRVEIGVGRGIYGREAIHMNVEVDLKDQAKNFRLFEETLTILKKAWTEKFFSHKGEFYTYPSPNFVWQHDMSPPNEEFMDLKNNTLKKISVVPQPYQKPHPPIHQVVDGIRSIEWAAKNGINTIMWIPTVKALKVKSKLIAEINHVFEKFDFLISSTVPIQPFKFGEKIQDPVSFMLIDFNTVTANLTGKPAISVPYKIVNGLPIGIQIMADSFKDHSLLQAAYALEKTVELPEVPI